MSIKQRYRYKYRPSKYGVRLSEVRCPTCGNQINWTKPIEGYEYSNTVTLLASCWSGDINRDAPEHLFIIRLKDLPQVSINSLYGTDKK